jgi:acetyl-CoA carboxylase biotin carboxylase subunit
MGAAALLAADAAGYRSAGTVEFLVDRDGTFYFMEMNTRIQVEHPVTEEQTDIDLVQQQILIASGEPLGLAQSDVTFSGHTLEVRINAEDPDNDFRPSPGKITSLHVPGGHGVRVDTHAYAQYTIPPYYDSLLAKLITHGKTRDEALTRMLGALEEFVVEGIHTTIAFHKKVLDTAEFRSGRFDTSFVERFFAAASGEPPGPQAAPTAAPALAPHQA